MTAPLVPIAIAFLLGVLAGTWRPDAPWMMLAALGLAGAALAAWPRLPARWALMALLCCWGCLGLLRMELWRAHPAAVLQERLPDEPEPVQVHGVVRDDPAGLFDPDDLGPQTCVLELRHVRTASGWAALAGRVRVTLQPPRTRLRYGDELLAEGEWSRVPAPGNPGQYDWRAALARQRVHGLLRVRPFHGLVVLRSGHGQGNPVLSALYRLRGRWERLLDEAFPPRDAGLLRAILLGERVALPERLKTAFVDTGTIHLLVISGFNVGLIAGLCELLLRWAGLAWRLRLAVIALVLGAYSVLTGLQPPVVRATVMAWVALGAAALDRDLHWTNTLAAAALLMLWIHPAQAFDPSFQLSFGAVASLLTFTGRFQRRLQPPLDALAGPWLGRGLAAGLSATAAVWVGLAPVLAWYFHLLAPVSLLANLLLGPLLSAVVVVGMLVLTAGTLIEAAVGWGSGLLQLLLEATLRCVAWCDALPGGTWFVGTPPAWWLTGYYGLLALSLLRRRAGLRAGQVLCCWAAAGTLAIWGGVAAHALAGRRLQVTVLDVGHGDCLVLRTPQGHVLLVDAGSEDAGRHRVVPYLRFAGITAVDALVLTHTDEDHLGGALPLLEQVRVGRLLTNGVRGATMSARRLRRAARDRAIPDTVLQAGMRLDAGTGVRLDVLHPPPGLVPQAAAASNDNSVVLSVAKDRVRFLLCGDLEEAGIPWLLRAGASVQAAVLKVPHHGSRLGDAGERLFQQVRPAVAVISAGRRHRLPAAETVAALQRTSARRYLTRDDGAVRFSTDGERLWIETGRSRRLLRLTPDGTAVSR